MADAIVAGLPPDQRDAYYIANAMEAYLRDSSNGFEYDGDIRGLCQSGQVVDCFLREGDPARASASSSPRPWS